MTIKKSPAGTGLQNQNNNVFSIIKEYIDFEELANEYGIVFDKRNKAICPFHEEKTASFHNYGTHGNCFGCNKYVDAIDLEAHFKGEPRIKAALGLAKRKGLRLPDLTKEEKLKLNFTNIAYDLLERFAIYCHSKIKDNEEAMEYTQLRGLDSHDLEFYKIGYIGSDNQVPNGFFKNGIEKKIAKHIGLIKGNEFVFKNRIIFPIWCYGKIVYITGRAVPTGSPKYLHLKNSTLLKNTVPFAEDLNEEICLITESISDSIAFKKARFPSCSLNSLNPCQEGKKLLSDAKAKLYFTLDSDDSGHQAAYKLARKYKGYLVDFESDKDPDETLATLGIDDFRNHTNKVIDHPTYYLEAVIKRESISECLKEIAQLELASDQDIWLSKLSKEHKGKGVTKASLRKDLEKVKQESKEQYKEELHDVNTNNNTIDPLDEYSEEEIKKALDLLLSPILIERLLILLNKSGLVGEERNKVLAYLACTSRLLPGKGKAISIIAEGGFR